MPVFPLSLVLAFALAVLATPAVATCFDPASSHLPMQAELDDGSHFEVIERRGDRLRYRVGRSPETTLEMTVKGAFFTTEAIGAKGAQNFSWSVDLTTLPPVAAGQSITAEATVTSTAGTSRRLWSEATVSEGGTITVGDCTYPVLRIETRQSSDGGPFARVVRSYQPGFMFSLETTIYPPNGPSVTTRVKELR
ncbi:hypothetical protein [Prosthecodimorpha staleyi]|uniref:DUF3108 domain-containing protein n=1 Tax=Prosthecodimorpha staleyi TaxID=2840188 RepID=A0A947D6S2_9HYPH|nr:hypothetical protein [Prosthecodimorpha staleyi]MBT9289147.1 hypothetical protein [Prosthecodimorpha staleyi]